MNVVVWLARTNRPFVAAAAEEKTAATRKDRGRNGGKLLLQRNKKWRENDEKWQLK